MKIAVLGTGNVGGVLGSRWAQLGHEIVFGSRDPSAERVTELISSTHGELQAASAREAADLCDVVILATPWEQAQELVRSLGDLSGKVLIDCINPVNASFTGLDLGHDTSAAEQIASWTPNAKVVKAFNTVSAAAMADPRFGGEQATLMYCGDDDDAKQIVHQLIEQLDFEPIDAGPLKMARYLEPLAMLYIHLAIKHRWGGHCAFKVIHR